MGLTARQLKKSLHSLARTQPAIARALDAIGLPEPRISDPGYATLLRTIIGQQVSTASARAMWTKLQAALDPADPAALLAAPDDTLRAAGLSRQKMAYARSLAGLIAANELDLQQLPAGDEDAIGALTRIKGIGRWSAEVYLLFSEGRPDIFPAGDLALQVAVGDLLALGNRPTEKAVRLLAEPWSPHRGAAAIFAWHHYRHRAKTAAGVTPL